MLHVLKKDIVSLKIKKTQKELNNELENEECEKIHATLRKNDKINRKHLQRKKKKKRLAYLKFKPTRPLTEKTEFWALIAISKKKR